MNIQQISFLKLISHKSEYEVLTLLLKIDKKALQDQAVSALILQ